MIHPSAQIHPEAKLGAGTTIGPGAIVDEHVVIGANCEIQAHAVLTGHTTLGDNNRVGYGAIVGGEPQDLAFDRETISHVVIGNNNTIREYATIHRGTKPGTATVVGNNCFLMAGAHLAHNCKLGDHVILANNVLCAGYVEIGGRAFIGGGAVIHQFCRIGRCALMQGNAGVSKDLPPFMVAAGANHLAGMNAVGLKRNGVPPENRMALKRLYHHLFRSGKNISEALRSLQEFPELPEIQEVVAFVQSSKRGVLTPRTKARAETDESV